MVQYRAKNEKFHILCSFSAKVSRIATEMFHTATVRPERRRRSILYHTTLKRIAYQVLNCNGLARFLSIPFRPLTPCIASILKGIVGLKSNILHCGSEKHTPLSRVQSNQVFSYNNMIFLHKSISAATITYQK